MKALAPKLRTCGNCHYASRCMDRRVHCSRWCESFVSLKTRADKRIAELEKQIERQTEVVQAAVSWAHMKDEGWGQNGHAAEYDETLLEAVNRMETQDDQEEAQGRQA